MVPIFKMEAALILAILAWSCTAACAADGSGQGECFTDQATGKLVCAVIRTLAYHEITSLTDGVDSNNGIWPVLSENGERAAFTTATYSPELVVHIHVIDAEGTGQREVDSYKPLCYCSASADISPDGSKVVSTDGIQLRVANADGSGAGALLNTGSIVGMKIIDNGQVFFMVKGDTEVQGSSPKIPVQRGIWTINFDGSGLRQIAGPDQIAALLGVAADSVSPAAGCFDLSSDGSRMVFAVYTEKRLCILGANSDGSGLHEFVFPKDYFWAINKIGISGDGPKMFYNILPNPCCSTPGEIGVFNFDGTGQRLLINATARLPSGFPGSDDPITMSHDGSRLLLGSSGVLMDTETGEMLALALRGGWWTSDPLLLVGDGMFRATMNKDASRILFVAADEKVIRQLAILDVNPASLGGAPDVYEARMPPPFVLTDGRSSSNITAKVTTTNTISRVSNAMLLRGMHDANVGEAVMLDDGTQGDLTSGDGIFSNNAIRANGDAVVGPRTVRIKAEVRGGDGKRHATAIDIVPFAVVDEESQAPAVLTEGASQPQMATQPQTARPPTAKPPTISQPPIAQPPATLQPAQLNLTGVWNCDDGGTYYLRQMGNVVWWDGDRSPQWANVARGTISGKTLNLEYADVPEGKGSGYGTLVLDIISNDELRAKEKPESYSGSRWWRASASQGPASTTPRPGETVNPWENPAVRQLIDEWLLQQDRCLKKLYPGAYIDKWGRACGNLASTTIKCDLTPDHPADWDSYHYLWYNNWCPTYYPYTVRGYIQKRQSGMSFEALAVCKGEDDVCIG